MLFKNISILDENLDLQENMYVGIKKEPPTLGVAMTVGVLFSTRQA